MLISQCRISYVHVDQCEEHAYFQLPNTQTRFKYLLEAITCSDAGLKDSMAMLKKYDRPGEKLSDFELADTHLLSHYPAEKIKSIKGGSNTQAKIAETTTASSSTLSFGKPSIGNTVARLRWNNSEEFSKLSKNQRHELIEWRKAKNHKDGPP